MWRCQLNCGSHHVLRRAPTHVWTVIFASLRLVCQSLDQSVCRRRRGPDSHVFPQTECMKHPRGHPSPQRMGQMTRGIRNQKKSRRPIFYYWPCWFFQAVGTRHNCSGDKESSTSKTAPNIELKSRLTFARPNGEPCWTVLTPLPSLYEHMPRNVWCCDYGVESQGCFHVLKNCFHNRMKRLCVIHKTPSGSLAIIITLAYVLHSVLSLCPVDSDRSTTISSRCKEPTDEWFPRMELIIHAWECVLSTGGLEASVTPLIQSKDE